MMKGPVCKDGSNKSKPGWPNMSEEFEQLCIKKIKVARKVGAKIYCVCIFISDQE